MRNSINVPILVCLMGIMGQGAYARDPILQSNSPVFPSLESPEITKALFKPEAGIQRKLEKIFPFHLGDKDLAVEIFAAYQLDDEGERVDSHASAPMLSIAIFERTLGGLWQCLDSCREFCQHGSYGEMGKVSFAFIGSDHPVLVLTDGFTNQGCTSIGSSYYLLLSPDQRLRLKKVLELCEFYDDTGYYEESEKTTSVKSETEILAEVKVGWYPIRITHKGYAPLKEAGQIVGQIVGRRDICETAIFRFDPTSETYQLQPGEKIEGWWNAERLRFSEPPLAP